MLYTLKGGYVYTNKQIVKTNVIVNDGKIIEISDNVLGEVVDVTGLYVAPSFIDPHVHMREPGFTESETIKTGSLAAARGGYTKVFLMPNTKPVISSIEAYQNFEASNYASMASAGAMLNNFTAMQQQYRNTMTPTQRIENNTQNTDLMSIQQTIAGIQKHSITTYKYIEPRSKDYFYLFLRKPDEYPITIEYKDLTYKFGNKKNEN